MTHAIPTDYFMQTRVKGSIQTNHLKNRINEVTVEFFNLTEGNSGREPSAPICSITYNYDTGEYVTRSGLKLNDEQLRMMTAAYSPALIQSEGIDMAAEYMTEYLPSNPVDVTEHGLLIYAGDVDLS